MSANAKVVNWEAVLDDLRRAGISMQALEREASIPRTSLLHYRDNGGRPKYDEGERLLRLWMLHTNHTQEQIPYTQPGMSGHQRRML